MRDGTVFATPIARLQQDGFVVLRGLLDATQVGLFAAEVSKFRPRKRKPRFYNGKMLV